MNKNNTNRSCCLDKKTSTSKCKLSGRKAFMGYTAILTLFILFFASCATVPPVYKVHETTDLKGIYYCLPKNKIQVQVTITNKTYQEGAIYQNYTYLIPEAVDTTFKYKISDITINNQTVADQSQWYCAVFDKNFGKDVTISFERSPDGRLKNVNTQAQDNTIDKSAMAFSVITNIANTGINDSSNSYNRNRNKTIENMDMLKIYFNEKDGYSSMQVNKSSENINSKKQTVTKTYKPSIEQAQELAREYERIRSEKIKLITGQQSSINDIELYNEIIFQLEKRQNEIIELFYGKIITSKMVLNFETDTCNVDSVLFYYNPDKGLRFPNQSKVDRAVEAVNYLDSNYIPFRINIKKNDFRLKVMYDNDDTTRKNRGSFYYRIPGDVKTIISAGETILRDTTLVMAQAGTIARLPIRAGFLRTRYDIVFDPATGAMTKLSVNETVVDKIFQNRSSN